MLKKDDNITSPELLKIRGNMSQWCHLGILSFLLIGGIITAVHDSSFQEAIQYATLGPCTAVFIMALLHNLLRLCHLSEEIRHIPGRYQSYSAVLKAVFCCNNLTALSYAASSVVTLWFWCQHGNLQDFLCRFGKCPFFMIFAAAFMWSHLIKMEESPLQDSLNIERLSSLDYGSGMALSFFYGYLRLVLPDTGERNKGIKKKIKKYINQNHLKDENFPVKKLFILIPKNLTIPSTLMDISGDMMEVGRSLEEEEIDRSGVKCRIYKNSVYKIKTEHEPIYIVAEGASPLKTYEEVMKYHQNLRERYQKYRDEIVFAFYNTLKCIIEQEDCNDVCELVYYVDKDEKGRKVNVAKILLERIREIKERNGHEEND